MIMIMMMIIMMIIMMIMFIMLIIIIMIMIILISMIMLMLILILILLITTVIIIMILINIMIRPVLREGRAPLSAPRTLRAWVRTCYKDMQRNSKQITTRSFERKLNRQRRAWKDVADLYFNDEIPVRDSLRMRGTHGTHACAHARARRKA